MLYGQVFERGDKPKNCNSGKKFVLNFRVRASSPRLERCRELSFWADDLSWLENVLLKKYPISTTETMVIAVISMQFF